MGAQSQRLRKVDQGRSIFALGYDVETSRFNVWVETDSVEGGWAPNLND